MPLAVALAGTVGFARIARAGLLAAFAVSSPVAATAAPASGAAPPPAPPPANVVVAIAGASAAVTAVREALAEPLARGGITPQHSTIAAVDPVEVLEPAPGDAGLLARVAIDVRPGRDAIVFIVDVRGCRVLVRRVAAAAGLDQVAVEEIAHIVGSSVRALKAGAQIGVAREEVEIAAESVQAPPTTAPSAAPGQPVSVQLGAAFAAESWASDEPFVPGASASLIVRWSRSWGRGREQESDRAGSGGGQAPALQRSRAIGLWLAAGYHGLGPSAGTIDLRLRGGAIAVLGIVELAAGRAGVLSLGLGPGLDVIHQAPRAADSATPDVAVTLAADRLRVVPLARAALRFETRALARALIYVALASDLLVSRPRYLVGRDGRDDVLFEPWRVRPALWLGGEWDLTPEAP